MAKKTQTVTNNKKQTEKNHYIHILLDWFFRAILIIQKNAVKFEQKHGNKQKDNVFTGIVLGIAMVLIFLTYWFSSGFAKFEVKSKITCTIFFIIGIYIRIVDDIGWRNSAVGCLIKCFSYSFMGSFFISLFIASIFQGVFMQAFILIFFFIWLIMSLIANSEQSLLMNEVLSGFSATIYTIGTSIMATTKYNLTFSLEGMTYSIPVNSISEDPFFLLIFLPIIGVSAFSAIMVKMKQYWMKKTGETETEGNT